MEGWQAMFTTDAVTKQDLADALQLANITSLASQLTNVNTRCHARAYAEIVNRLTARGFTRTQIDAWDSDLAGPIERDLTVFFALSLAWVNTQVDPKFVTQFDRRDELSGNSQRQIKPVPVITGGALIEPTYRYGNVSAGTVSTDADLFVMDPDDSRLGETTRW